MQSRGFKADSAILSTGTAITPTGWSFANLFKEVFHYLYKDQRIYIIVSGTTGFGFPVFSTILGNFFDIAMIMPPILAIQKADSGSRTLFISPHHLAAIQSTGLSTSTGLSLGCMTFEATILTAVTYTHTTSLHTPHSPCSFCSGEGSFSDGRIFLPGKGGCFYLRELLPRLIWVAALARYYVPFPHMCGYIW